MGLNYRIRVTFKNFNYSKRLLRVKESSQDTIQLEWSYLDVFLNQKNGSQTILPLLIL